MNDIIKDNTIKNVKSVVKDISFAGRSCYGNTKYDSIFFYSQKCIRMNGYDNGTTLLKNYNWYNTKDFLNHFKIPFEDIV